MRGKLTCCSRTKARTRSWNAVRPPSWCTWLVTRSSGSPVTGQRGESCSRKKAVRNASMSAWTASLQAFAKRCTGVFVRLGLKGGSAVLRRRARRAGAVGDDVVEQDTDRVCPSRTLQHPTIARKERDGEDRISVFQERHLRAVGSSRS